MFSFVEIFIRPTKVFDRVREQNTWVMPFFAVVFLLALPTVMVILSGGGIELITLQRYEHNTKLAEAIGGEDGIERAVNSSNERWTKLLIVSRTSGSAALSLIVLAIALMLASGFLDLRPNFFAMLGTLSYSIFPFALIGAIITLIMLEFSLDHGSFDLENMPALNLSRLLNRSSSSAPIFSMAEGMDILVVGEMLLTSLGLTRLTQLNYLQALAVCGALWAIVILWKAALAVYL